jgi:hypothetical protein
MAIFDVSSMGESRSLPCRVGWRRCYGRPRWRAYLIIRERHTANARKGLPPYAGYLTFRSGTRLITGSENLPEARTLTQKPAKVPKPEALQIQYR